MIVRSDGKRPDRQTDRQLFPGKKACHSPGTPLYESAADSYVDG